MRFVLLALIVANIAFFGWARWVDVPDVAPSPSVRDASVPPLQLDQKRSPADLPSAPTSSPPAVTASSIPPGSTAARCRTLGPFEDLNTAGVISDRLRSRGFSPRDRSADTTNPNVYWVYIGELTSEMQRHAIQTLNAAGIHDAAPMTQAEQSDRVSVGVFSDQAHAVHRAEQVRALGLKPTLGLRQRNITAHWLDFDVKPSDTEPQPAELLGAAPHSSLGLGPVKAADCPAIGGSG